MDEKERRNSEAKFASNEGIGYYYDNDGTQLAPRSSGAGSRKTRPG